MNSHFTFLIQSSVALTLFYMVYWLFLRKETYYRANRFFLLFTLLASVLIPLAPIHYTVFVEAGQSSMKVVSGVGSLFKAQPNIGKKLNGSFSLSWTEGVMIVYFTGVAIFLLRLLFQTTTLLGIMMKYKIKSMDGIRIVENEKYGLPFSFFNIVFINPKFHTQDELPEILAHEKVHIRENHCFDLLFIELLTVIFWFNPFIWFFERSIKQNHEYLADKGVLAQGHRVGHYQALLINQLMGMQIIGVTNNLNFALNTNRLKMMTKKKTSAIARVKFVWALPAIALLLFAFAEPAYKAKEAKTENSVLTLQKGEKEFVIKGTVVREDNGKPLPGATVMIKGTTVGTVSDVDGKYMLVDSNPKVETSTGSLSSELVVSYVGFETLINLVSASGNAIGNNSYTFKMKEGIVKLDLQQMLKDIPPPPPPKKQNATDVPPPPPPKTGTMEAEKKVHIIIEGMPEYPGGSFALGQYITKMQQKLMQAEKIRGKAKVGFTIDTEGKVTNLQVLEKDNDMAAKGALSIVSRLKPWKPGSQNGNPVPVNYVLPIEF